MPCNKVLFWQIWASKVLFTIAIVQMLLSVTFVCFLSTAAVVLKALKRRRRLRQRFWILLFGRLPLDLHEVAWGATTSALTLLWRKLEFLFLLFTLKKFQNFYKAPRTSLYFLTPLLSGFQISSSKKQKLQLLMKRWYYTNYYYFSEVYSTWKYTVA